ncbi:MAG: hypothetical protein AAF763_10800 [Pseudomonadota bacterium]
MELSSFKPLSAVAVVATAGAAVYAAASGFLPVDLDRLQAAEIGTLFLSLLFAALVIERAAEVFAGSRFGDAEARLRRPKERLRARVRAMEERIEAELERVIASPQENAKAIADRDAYVAELRAEAEAARRDLEAVAQRTEPKAAELRARKRVEAGAITMLLGAATAAVGIRVLETLSEGGFETALGGAAPPAEQLFWLRLVDVALTALLLAGGADGLHQLIKDLTARRPQA